MKYENNNLLAPGHRGCAGCGQLLAARHVINALGKNTIISCATGCLEVTTTPYPESAWRVPWIHSLFENAPAVATGVLNAAKVKYLKNNMPNIAVLAGDGSTFDIGFGALSGMWSRGDDILYVCFDNEAYMNTGNQYSAATPYGSKTETSLHNNAEATLYKKNIPEIAVAHNVPYVATSTIGYPKDIIQKIKKALTFSGPKYIQILAGCVPGWGYDPKLTIELGRLAHQSGHYPIFEKEYGKLTNSMKIPQNIPKVQQYLKPQKRFSHLFKDKKGERIIEHLQTKAEQNILKYNL